MANQNTPRHSARFGARYGVSVRKRFEMVEVKQRKEHMCPKCGFEKVTRVSTGIFSCKKCNAKYAGGAFYPQTLSGGIIAKMVAQKAFSAQAGTKLLSEVKGVEEATPAVEADATPLTDEEKIDQMMAAKPKKKRGRGKREEVKLKMGFQDSEAADEDMDEGDDEELAAAMDEESEDKPGHEAA